MEISHTFCPFQISSYFSRDFLRDRNYPLPHEAGGRVHLRGVDLVELDHEEAGCSVPSTAAAQQC